jgi:hypothetical protein
MIVEKLLGMVLGSSLGILSGYYLAVSFIHYLCVCKLFPIFW